MLFLPIFFSSFASTYRFVSVDVDHHQTTISPKYCSLNASYLFLPFSHKCIDRLLGTTKCSCHFWSIWSNTISPMCKKVLQEAYGALSSRDDYPKIQDQQTKLLFFNRVWSCWNRFKNLMPGFQRKLSNCMGICIWYRSLHKIWCFHLSFGLK